MSKNTDNYRIDSKVITTMLAVAVLFLILMAFRFTNSKPCPGVDFSFRTANKFDVAYQNEKVYFSSEVKYNANEWEWDFGDKTPVDKTSGPYVSHEYATPGVYTVRLTINGKCQQVKNISIDKRERNKKKLYLRPIWPPDGTLQAGRDYYFGDSTNGAESWSWFFGTDETNRTKQNVVYQFVEPGDYKVILMVNGDMENGTVEKTFRVVAPPRINAPNIANNNNGGGRPNNVNIPANPGGDAVPAGGPGKSLEELLQEQSKVPALGETTLKAYILDIAGAGGANLRKYLKNGNCNIIFNGKSLSMDQLKENMKVHAEYGKSLTVKQEVDPKENYIKVIDISAELNRKNRFLLKDKDRKYPY
jgi:PKD domain